MSFSWGLAIIQLLWILIIGVSIYLLVLLIKLARRGIQALDKYIADRPTRNK
ncbi:hypothetical protein [Paenibacillus terrigena]|uniref:hypothetical protein n=1 Tax=Paenibacillus terrigena TaxID=369333 RepID=UPI00036B80A5|nr:hypothetical protein [Paenibacillus terrigena]